MGGLVRIFLAICGVCEAEGRALRDNSLLLIKKGGYAFLGVCFMGAGMALLLGALYALLAPLVPDWLLLALIGVGSLLCALCLFRLSAAPRPAAPDAGGDDHADEPARDAEPDSTEGAGLAGAARRQGGAIENGL